MRRLNALVFAALLPLPAVAADCAAYQKQLADIEQEYKPQYDGYQQDGDRIKGEAGANFDVTWADTVIQFGTPTVTVRDQKFTLGVPQVTMKMQDIRFGTPSVVMVPTKTGQYPEFTCDHAVIPSCAVKWSDIITLIPKTFMQQQDIKTLIPEFTFQDTSFVIGVPEFSLQQQKIVIGLPQFKLTSAYINAGKIKDESDTLTNNISATKARQIKETVTDTSKLYSCFRDDLFDQKAKASAAFEDGISKLNASISFMKTVGADPANVTGADGKSVNLVAQLADLITKREAAFKQFDDGIAKLEESEKSTVSQLTAKPS